jgi:hypothetical protein
LLLFCIIRFCWNRLREDFLSKGEKDVHPALHWFHPVCALADLVGLGTLMATCLVEQCAVREGHIWKWGHESHIVGSQEKTVGEDSWGWPGFLEESSQVDI